jgi:WD40 repeat protein
MLTGYGPCKESRQLLPIIFRRAGSPAEGGKTMLLPDWLNALRSPGRHALWVRFALLGGLIALLNTISFRDTREPSFLILRGHQYRIKAVAFSPDGTTLATGGGLPLSEQAAELKLWDVATGKERFTLSGHTGSVAALAFSPSGKVLASVSDDQTVRLWDRASGRERAVLRGHTSSGKGVNFSPNGDTLASTGLDQTVRLWDVANGQVRTLLQGHVDWLPAMAFSPDSQRLATLGGGPGDVKLWDSDTGKLRTTLPWRTQLSALHPRSLICWALVYGPDGLLACDATYAGDLTVERLDTSTQQGVVVWQGHLDWITALSFSPDGKQLAAGNWDGTVMFLEAATGQEWAIMEPHRGAVTALAFSADGRRIAAGCRDKTVILGQVPKLQPF